MSIRLVSSVECCRIVTVHYYCILVLFLYILFHHCFKYCIFDLLTILRIDDVLVHFLSFCIVAIVALCILVFLLLFCKQTNLYSAIS